MCINQIFSWSQVVSLFPDEEEEEERLFDVTSSPSC